MNDFNSFLNNLNPEQRFRFNDFLQSLKDEGMKVAYTNHGFSREDITIDSIMERSNQITEWEEIRAKQELAASKGETTIPEDDWGVHRTHCCSKHGCKYGDPDCPVEINLLKQDYPCESCRDEKDNESYYMQTAETIHKITLIRRLMEVGYEHSLILAADIDDKIFTENRKMYTQEELKSEFWRLQDSIREL